MGDSLSPSNPVIPHTAGVAPGPSHPMPKNLLKVFEDQFVRPVPGRTLITGAKRYPNSRPDRKPLYKDVVGVDMFEGEGVDVVCDLEEQWHCEKYLGDFSHIECLSVLEHSKRPWLLAKNIEYMLLSRGSLYITVPFVWPIHAYPNDYFRFTIDGIKALFPNIEWDPICYSHVMLTDFYKVPHFADKEGHHYFGRSEVYGFGYRRAR